MDVLQIFFIADRTFFAFIVERIPDIMDIGIVLYRLHGIGDLADTLYPAYKDVLVKFHGTFYVGRVVGGKFDPDIAAFHNFYFNIADEFDAVKSSQLSRCFGQSFVYYQSFVCIQPTPHLCIIFYRYFYPLSRNDSDIGQGCIR